MFKHPARLDVLKIVTKGSAEKHEMEVKETMKKLEDAGYRFNQKKANFPKKAQWIGHKIDQNGIRPLQDKLEAITKIEIPIYEIELKYFLGRHNTCQSISKIDIPRKLLKKNKTSEYRQMSTQNLSTTSRN